MLLQTWVIFILPLNMKGEFWRICTWLSRSNKKLF